MNRKKFIKIAGILGLASTSGCIIGENAPNNASGDTQSEFTGTKYKWKMVTTWPPGFPVLGEVAEYYADWVRKASGGRIDITVYGGGEIVPALQTFDTVSAGQVEMGCGTPYYWAGKAPSMAFFSSIPYGFNAQMMNSWMVDGGGYELWKEVYSDFNIIPFMGGNTGVQMGGWFNTKIESMKDFKGLKMRIPGFGADVIERAGASSILVPGSELYTDLERGVIDATEWVGPYHDYRMGFHKIAKYYYYPGWHEFGSQLEFTVNKDIYEALPEDLQMILELASQKAQVWCLARLEHKNAEYLQKIKDETDVEILPFPDEVLSSLRKYSQEAMKDIAAQDKMSKKVYQSILDFKEQIQPWSEITEKKYYEVIDG